jgi:hypothetical protein
MPHVRLVRIAALAVAACVLAQGARTASAQVVVYESFRPIVAAPAAVTNYYTPAGNYAAVTAYSPPVVASMPASSVAVTSYFAPATPTMATAVPITSYYAPAAVAVPLATTAYYAPAPAIMAAPVTPYFAPAAVTLAPTAVAIPLYRRGLFGGYRPVRTAYYPY